MGWDGEIFSSHGMGRFSKISRPIPSHPMKLHVSQISLKNRILCAALDSTNTINSFVIHITLNITIDSVVFFLRILIHSYRSCRQGFSMEI